MILSENYLQILGDNHMKIHDFFQFDSTVVILINATTLMHTSNLSTNNFGNNHFGQK